MLIITHGGTHLFPFLHHRLSNMVQNPYQRRARTHNKLGISSFYL